MNMMTPEEQQWRASVCNPAKAAKMLRYQYILLGSWIVLSMVWLVLILTDRCEFSWMTLIVLLLGYINAGLGIVNNKRVIGGRKPY